MIKEMHEKLDKSCDQRQETDKVIQEIKDMIKVMGYNDKLVELLVDAEKAKSQIEYRINEIQRHLETLYLAKELNN